MSNIDGQICILSTSEDEVHMEGASDSEQLLTFTLAELPRRQLNTPLTEFWPGCHSKQHKEADWQFSRDLLKASTWKGPDFALYALNEFLLKCQSATSRWCRNVEEEHRVFPLLFTASLPPFF